MAAAIPFQATDTDSGTIGDNGTHTFTLTVASAAGQERYVVIGGVGDPAAVVDYDACTIDGQAATRVGTVVRGADDGGGVAVFLTAYRANGTAGTTINVVATANCPGGSVFEGYCATYSLNDADTTTATPVTSAANDPNLSINTATGGVAVAAMIGYSAASPLGAWTGLTEDYDALRVSGDVDFTGASAAIVTGQTPRAISLDMTPDLTGSIASICVSFNPDAGGGTPDPVLMGQICM